MAVAERLVSQRPILATRFHEALSFDKESLPLEPYHRRGMREVDRAWAEGRGNDAPTKVLEGHLRHIQEYGYFVVATSRGAAEALVYSVDSLIKYAANEALIHKGDRDSNVVGGYYLAQNITLLEAFRVVANWQRHHLEWDGKPFNDANFNHRCLNELGLLGHSDVPVEFLKRLKRRSYFQLERDIHGALEYLVCEIGMKHAKRRH